MTDLFDKTLKLLKKEADNAHAGLSEKIEPIFSDLTDTIGALNDIPEYYFNKLQPDISAQLNAIDARAANTADEIMTACETMMAALGELPDKAQNTFQEQINIILQSCSFEDLITQHTKEIKLRNDELTDDMNDLKNALSGAGNSNPRERTRDKREKRKDGHLMNGPTVDVQNKTKSSSAA